MARLREINALVDVDLAVGSRPAGRAAAKVAACVLAACAAVHARRALTHVVERLTVLSSPTFLFCVLA